MTLDQIVSAFVEQGLLGVIIVVLGLAYYRKDQEVARLNEVRQQITERVTIVAEQFLKIIRENGGK